MRPDYKNWMPKGMVIAGCVCFLAALALFLIFGVSPVMKPGTAKTVLRVVLLTAAAVLAVISAWMVRMYSAFSYSGKRQLSRRIIEGVAEFVKIPEGGRGLDVGCGSGALTIACAKRNPKAFMLGVDRWGKEYASYSKALCESNAAAEGAANTAFQKGDAAKLDFPDGSFDAVTSNYVYHNIPGGGSAHQALLLETLRTLKKGGIFAIHDIMPPVRYGDMQAFAEKLRGMGYERVELIDTAKGMFIGKREAGWMALGGSTLLTGIK